ncbi:LytR C-terminal domain-containing protein [Amycolatopsis nigrescens]|uniref:LytR C-terminal domain-containing protein n=1 Tax=Amycolatopsis nigrescens TaxID=381445 RepID=UPI00036412A9|nr:LytR C-terminal domain-containing protein [Amycolatopsis nigrescens]
MSLLDGLSRPMKLAGVALIGIALVAAVIGTTTALTGGSDNTAAPPSSSTAPSETGQVPPPSSPPPSEPPSSPPPSPSTPPPSPSSPAPSSPAPGQPGATPGQDGGQPGDQQASSKWVTVRVYNNSLIHGLAERAGDDLRKQGWNVAEVSNYPSGKIPTTTAYYRPGTDEEAAAKALGITFGMRVEARFEGIQQSHPGVIVIVTNDYKGASGKVGS